ncbi:MAG: queuosine precursor transporter [Proteobacteria bacterium]|nr:queuosine precursor transporter [Pseudomonadota bacterium]
MDSFLQNFIEYCHTFKPEYITLFSIIVSGVCIIFCKHIFGLTGLYIYNILAVILANIQVLRLCQFTIIEHPIALGTVLFSTTFLVSDIINEIYGADKAKSSIKYCFLASVLCTLLMIVDLGHKPLNKVDPTYMAMVALFVPSLRILTSSLIAFFISQWFDVLLFKWFKNLLNGRLLWLRTLIVSLASFLLDNILFCYLAWYLLSSTPLAADEIFKTYVLGTYITRVVLGVLLIPVIYICRRSGKEND